MKIKLTDRGVKALKATGKRYFVQVEGYPGLQLRVNQGGNITFVYRYTHQKQRRFMSIGIYPTTTIKEALEEYGKVGKQVAQGIDPLAVKEAEAHEENPTVKQLTVRYLENYVDVQLKPRTQKEYRRQLNKYILPKLGKRKAKEIKRAAIVALIERQAKQNGPIMANRNLAVIKGLFSYAVKVGILEHSPAAGISPPGKPKAKDRVLTLDEIVVMLKVLEEATRDARDILSLVLLTGQRPGEVCAMHTRQIKGDWWELAGGETKSGRAHRVYLSKWARAIIKSRQDDGLTKGYLFPSHGTKRVHIQPDILTNWFHRRLNKLFEEAGIAKPFTAHDLRRSAATGMAMLGHAAVVPDILNHAPQGVTRQVYDRYDRGPEIKRALIAWETAIKEALAGGGQTVVEVDFK